MLDKCTFFYNNMEGFNLKLAEALKPYNPLFRVGNNERPILNVGTNNVNYNEYLMYLFQNSPKHGSLVKGKAKYIYGKGYAYNPKVSATDTLNDLAKKCILNYEIFNAFYIEVIRNKKGKVASLHPIPNRNIARNYDGTKYWYIINPQLTTIGSSNLVEFAIYGEPNPEGLRELFFYAENENPANVYPTPNYFQGLNYIAADVEVSKHTYTNSKQGFKATKHVTLVNGEPTEEIKSRIKKKFSDTYTGEGGESIILDFVSDINRKTVIDDLGVSDLVKENYSAIDELIRNNIFSCHEVTSPELFGISVPGKLGGTNNLKESYQIFNNTYVYYRRDAVHYELMKLVKDLNDTLDTSVMGMMPTDPIGVVLDSATIATVLTIDEQRELLGYEPMPQDTPKPIAAPISQAKHDDLLAIFSEFGANKADFNHFVRHISLSVTKADISDIYGTLAVNPDATIEDIANEMDLSENDVKSALNQLEKQGKISIGTNGIEIIEQPTATDYRVMYSYEWKDEIPVSERDTAEHPSRPFCQRLIALDKYYSRKDIESISARLGYSVFDRAGGWWNDGSGTPSPSCRHRWVGNLVSKNK
jgi:DNA-binding Lrp family transcriptional regulator